jgi:hypothetical protein
MSNSLAELFETIELKIDSFILIYKGEKQTKITYDSLLEINVDKYRIENEIVNYKKEDAISLLNNLIKKIEPISSDYQAIQIIAKNLMLPSFRFYGVVETNKVTSVLSFYYMFLKGLLEKIDPVKEELVVIEKHKLILKSQYYDTLLNFEYEGIELFDIDKYTTEKLKNNILFFQRSEFEKITPALNFKAKYDYYAYYAITKLAEAYHLEFKKIKNVLVNSKLYNSKKRDEANSKNQKKESLDPNKGGYAGFISQFQNILFANSET